jgi:hypothetical protein
MEVAAILERIDQCIRELEAIRAPRLWRPRRRLTVPGPKVPMTRRGGAGGRD